ncbi:class I SAM-dependent methyltransferase [Pseudonocardia pini]|uniref:class I SAM-dependent methyltransferase n=1 Tax=Pseudonocardia pini TaxID=2758030 RepID=UPI0028A77D9C|nr:class I SAM-dependent methyltransferase [Pseudonocardia pini]
MGDYIDQTFATPGTTARTVAEMLRLGGLTSARRVCEIGPGTGRYSEKVIEALHPETYLIYETATDWWPHLRALPHAVVQPCDGHTLTPTPTASIDLVHAQKVFVYLPFETVMGYVDDMIRVARPGGVIAFDVITEECLTDDLVTAWIAAGTIYRPVPREWLIEYLGRHGVHFRGSCLVRLVEGRTELLVFRKSG